MPKFDYSRDLGFWQLPMPAKGEKRVWHPIVMVTRRQIPFGYTQSEENPSILLPVVDELEALELAKKHLKQYSYREVAAWLTTQTGRSITAMGLKKRVDIERRRKKAVTIKRQLTRRLEKALKEIERLEKQSTGYYTVESEDS